MNGTDQLIMEMEMTEVETEQEEIKYLKQKHYGTDKLLFCSVPCCFLQHLSR